MRVGFPAGNLAEHPAVVALSASPAYSRPTVAVLVRPEHQESAAAILADLSDRADALNPYRGKNLRASSGAGLSLQTITLPPATRLNTIVPQPILDELDLSIAAVRDHHEMLSHHGLGVRRGILLAGPPGVGKSALSAVVANELVAQGFTVCYIEAKVGTHLLTTLTEELEKLARGAGVLCVLEDVDLWVRERNSAAGGGGLSQLLEALDAQVGSRILTLASTNDVSVLDAAAIRCGRMDAILTLDYPDTAAAAHILSALVEGIPGGPELTGGSPASRT